MEASLIYCDDRIAVINKPPGLSMATKRDDPHAAARRLVEALSFEARASSGLDFGPVLMVHRLDAGTTGLVLLARDETVHRELAQVFSLHLVEKTYLALVWGHLRKPAGTYDAPLAPDARDRRRMSASREGKRALTHYRTLARKRYVALVELKPETGRTHQLRVHLGHAGHWIVGDDLYAGARHHAVREPALRAALAPTHLLLHAWRLRLPDSCGFLPLHFEAGLPPDFASALDALGIDISGY